MIVTGCQRSGTKTLAAIFGIYHEHQFTPFTRAIPARVASEVSWLAVPWLSHLAEQGPSAKQGPTTSVLHLVRDPVAVINSLVGMKFWKDQEHEHYREFIYKHLKSVNPSDSPILQSVQYWVGWNHRVSEAHPVARLRIEDIHTSTRLNGRTRASLTSEDIREYLPTVLKASFMHMKKDYGYV